MNLPPILYHYTSIEAFEAIVKSEKLRMTRFNQMNDPSELDYGFQKIKKCLDQKDSVELKPDYREFVYALIEFTFSCDFYVTSFSKTKDSLEQWRAYAPQGGVSIGFCSKEVERGYIKPDLPAGKYIRDRGSVITANGGFVGVRSPQNLSKCVYSEDQIDEMICRCVDGILSKSSFQGMFEDMNRENMSDLSGLIKKQHLERIYLPLFIRCVLNFVVKIKHYAYKNEEEFRWCSYPAENQNSRRFLSDSNKEYVEAGFHREDIIKEVWISPHGDTRSIRNILEYYQKTMKLNYKIIQSEIPYRLS